MEESRAALGRGHGACKGTEAWNCILGFEEHKLLGQDVSRVEAMGKSGEPGGLDLETRRRFSGF